MLKVTYKKFGVHISHIYFASENQVNAEIHAGGGYNSDIVFSHGISPEAKFKNSYLFSTQHTLIKILTPTEEDLFSALGKHLRSHIKRSMKDENIEICFHTSRDLIDNPDILANCRRLYEKMYSDKGMNVKFNSKLAKAYISINALCIAMAYMDNQAIGFSGFIYHGENARLWIAAFDFRNTDNILSQLFSRTHKRLDWEMILWCKAHGVKYLDFGGVSSFENPDGISKFKLEFEQENKITYNNYLIAGNFLGRFLIFLWKCRQKLKCR